ERHSLHQYYFIECTYYELKKYIKFDLAATTYTSANPNWQNSKGDAITPTLAREHQHIAYRTFTPITALAHATTFFHIYPVHQSGIPSFTVTVAVTISRFVAVNYIGSNKDSFCSEGGQN
ncbi:unnamed protein product, partial [Prunus brigantina]